MIKKIAYQGRPGAYSHLACIKAFPKSDPISCETFEEVFEKTENKETDLAFIPIENSQAGRVADIHNLLPKSNLLIAGEFFHKIQHQLLGLPESSIEKIVTAESHFHALAQCRDFLSSNNIKSILSSDTAGAAEEISKSSDLSRGAIASELAAEIYGLKVIKRNIEDAYHNTTRFLFMKEKIDNVRKNNIRYITSFLFKLRNISSALYKALGGFSSNRVNMLKIESYMLEGSFTATQFYIDIEGHPEDENVKLALEELGFFSKEVKILGSYSADKFRYLNS